MKVILFIGALLWSVMSDAAIETPETLFGVKQDAEQLSVQVVSHGCTSNESFRVENRGSELTLFRVKPDHCRRLPHKIWLTFLLPVTEATLTLNNPIKITTKAKL